MSEPIELTEAFLAKIAGWDVMKQARALVERCEVIDCRWSPPLLTGIVREGELTHKAGLSIKGSIDIDNLCTCRASRQRGIICVHSITVGLYQIHGRSGPKPAQPPPKRNLVEALRSPPTAKRAVAAPSKRLGRAQPDEAGEPIEISVIIPPNFLKSIERGRTTVCFEAEGRHGRCPLNALPLNSTYKLSSQDAALLDLVEVLSEGEPPAMLALDRFEFSRLLGSLTGHPRVTLGRGQSLEVPETPVRLALTANLLDSGQIEIRCSQPNEHGTLIEGKPSWLFTGARIARIDLPESLKSVLAGPVRIGRDQVPPFLSQDWGQINAQCDVSASFKIEDFVLESLAPVFQLHLVGGLARLEAQLKVVYGEREYTLGSSGSGGSFWMPDPASPVTYATRDWQGEARALERLRQSGFAGPNQEGHFQLLGQNPVLSFFSRDYPELERTWKVTLEERLEKSAAKNLERIEPTLQATPSGEQWFDLNINFATSGGEKFSAAEIQRLILSGQNHVRLRNGRIGLLDTGAVEELQEVLLDCAPVQGAQGYRVANTQAAFLDSTIRERTPWQLNAPTEWRQKVPGAAGAIDLTPPDLGPLENQLRSYQKQGVAWLRFLRENNFGGILADEMGLGKTVQTLALLRLVRTAKADRHAPSLVVCPTSLVFNWVAEAGRFTPDLKVIAVHGTQRTSQLDQVHSADLVITSYALIRRDAEVYRRIEFDTVVLDEAQHIKNRQTQNAQAVKSIRARHRLVLTGTPLENSVLDLWSIFDFLMPGYLGSAADFRERYEQPIVREKDGAAQSRLARRVRPFLLRRLKRDVAKELPAKIENISFCELSPDQKGVYQQVLEAGRREVMAAVGAQGAQKSRMLVLNTLLRLRQTCCDLRLLKLESTSPESISGKLDLFEELLDESLDGGHRVLVFSQFVSMLGLIRERLEASSIEHCYLDGSTRDRAGEVEKFQKGSAPVFLISLKAGGVGLNLTAADTVIHFDPWWNPAVEDQASDRAHRIGQDRVVTVYKLITRGTVEEKILSLQNRKRAVIGGVLENDPEAAESLTWEEIQELLT
ncbi:MAG: DEAD/DEAH box helicase [Verrucomicrobia bacterium]|nr:DEAD/DEAH box helicase [Verrucomicrobiota bacterium]